VIAASALLAAQVPATRGLAIDEVIVTTLEENPDVRTARAGVDAERGVLVQAARPFDARPSAIWSSSRRDETVDLDLTDPTSSHSSLEAASQVGVTETFRSGVTATSDIALTRTLERGPDRLTTNQFTMTAGLTLPLLQGRGGGIDRAIERAAALGFRASEHTVHATAGSAVLGATVAYWQYRAAYMRAEIQRAAARRAQQSVQEVEILIRADERPRSDIDLMVANAATKHVAELEADRQIVHARNALALAMGLDLPAAAALAPPTTDFPDAERTEPLTLDTLVADALAHQDQIVVASIRKESAQEIRVGATSQMRPRVDLQLTAGYTGLNNGVAFGRTFSSVFNNVRGPNVSLAVVFEPSNVNSSLRGGLIAANAAYSQAVVDSERLTRAVRLNVADALTGLTSTRAQLAGTREAVERAHKALETVQRNFELGTATLFDRILAEDTVTNAEVASLNANLQYATALVTLQFARGVLIDGEGVNLVADPSRVLRALREDAR
jgi:outer membrane protein